MKYLLFIYELEEASDLEYIVYQLRKVSKENIGMISFDSSVILNFESDKSKEEVSRFMVENGVLHPFFVGNALDFDAFLSQHETVALFGITIEDGEYDEEDDEEDEDEIKKIIERKNITVKPENLDTILDKIASKGMESLTKKEKQFLENYNYER